MKIKEALDALGLQAGASPGEVKKAYHRLAKESHPDTHPGDKAAEEKFKTISAANDVLVEHGTDPAQDEAAGSAGFSGFSGFGDMADIMDQLRFAHMMGVNSNPTIQAQVGVPVSMFFKGAEFEYRYTRVINQNGLRQQLTETVRVSIEPNTPVGSVKVFSQKGNHVDPKKPVGDLRIILLPVSDETYQVNGLNLTRVLELDVFEAVLGGSIEVDCPDGSKVKLKIKPGTQHEAIYRMNGKGLTDANRTGSLDVMIHVTVPVLAQANAAKLKALVSEFRQEEAAA